MGAEGESGSVICESLRQKDSVKDTKRKATCRSSFLYFEWIMNNNSEQNLQRRRTVMEVSGPGDSPGPFALPEIAFRQSKKRSAWMCPTHSPVLA